MRRQQGTPDWYREIIDNLTEEEMNGTPSFSNQHHYISLALKRKAKEIYQESWTREAKAYNTYSKKMGREEL